MTTMNARLPLLICSLMVSATALAQAVVHYPDAQHDTPPQYAFPFYTPGVGAVGDSVRAQFHCPDMFLQAQGLTAGYVTKVGFSLGGAGAYNQFVLRAGTTSQASLGNDWAVNLPDQRVQRDLSGSTIAGGGTAQSPVGQWVDFDLDYPFYYAPGDHMVVDLTTKLETANSLCATSLGGGLVQRAYNFNYQAGAHATAINHNGIKVRFTFAPLAMIEFGVGCAGSSGVVPDLQAIGAPQVGSQIVITADQAAPNGLGLFVFGFSRTSNGATPLPQDLGGGCQLLVAGDLVLAQTIPAAGLAATAVTIPPAPSLRGTVLYTQFAQLDVTSPAVWPFVLSEAGMLSVF